MYLGLLLTEVLNYDDMAKAVAKSASRSLGLLIAKCKTNGGFEYSTFTGVYFPTPIKNRIALIFYSINK
jgi:hypothetical protein